MLRYLFFKFLSGIGYALTILLFYPNKDILSSIYLILIQEFIFSFFLTYYRINVIAKKRRLPDKHLKVLSYLGLVLIIIFIPKENISFGIFIALNMLLFPYYLKEASDYESYSFKKAIRLENYIAPLSVLLFFIISLILYLFELGWTGLIFIRFFIFYTLYIIIIRKKKKKLEFIINLKSEKSISIINVNLLLILSFFIFKILLMKNGLTLTDNSGIEGKLYLFGYDLIAAIYGFLLRYFVFKKIAGREKFKTILVCFVLASILIYFTFLIIPINLITKFTILMSFIIAAGYGLFCLISNYKFILIGVLITILCSSLIIFTTLELSVTIMFLGYLILFYSYYKLHSFSEKIV